MLTFVDNYDLPRKDLDRKPRPAEQESKFKNPGAGTDVAEGGKKGGEVTSCAGDTKKERGAEPVMRR